MTAQPARSACAAEADLIVVGAGSAGCIVASRLAQTSGLSVLLLDVGRSRWRFATKMPAAVLGLVGHPRYDWGHHSEPDPSRDGRFELWSRGKLLGGSSAINGMAFIRGAATDFDAWERQGARGWNWSNVMPMFRRLERADDFDDATRGRDGPLPVSRLSHVHRLTPRFVEACQTAGIRFNGDLNGVSQEGVGYVQANIARGCRVDSYAAFVKPQLNRNLCVIEGHLVERILLDGNRAVGVAANCDGISRTVRARAGVILCAGAIGSPHILMLSGLGPAQHLRASGIEPRLDVPAVGQNLMDHPAVFADVEVDGTTANNEAQPLNAIWHIGHWLVRGRGPASNPAVQALAFFRSSPEQPQPNLQFQLYAFARTSDSRLRRLENRPLMSLSVNVSHPDSRGFIRLKNANPRAPPEIHPRLLAATADVERLAQGFKWAKRVIGTAPFASHVMKDHTLGVETSNAVELENFIRSNTEPLYHFAGTCRMGSDPAAVVDPNLRVQGIRGLWVADTSIFPSHISGNTHATALMIGERAADLIRSAAVSC